LLPDAEIERRQPHAERSNNRNAAVVRQHHVVT